MTWRVWIHWPKSDLTEWVPVGARSEEEALAVIAKRYAGYSTASRPVATKATPILNAQQWAEGIDDAA